MSLNHVWGQITSRIVPWVERAEPHDAIAQIRSNVCELKPFTPAELQLHCEKVRTQVARTGVDDASNRHQACALMVEALRRSLGIELYDVQLQASLALARGGIAEMRTGEGKTFSCSPAALLHALTGRGVHVATTNAYLADRDCHLLVPAYRLLGITVGLLPERAAATEKRKAYQCDVTYGTGHEFGFDYLRDQLTLRASAKQELGRELQQHLAGSKTTTEPLIQRGLYYSIVDEADNVLLDDATSPLILAGASTEEPIDADVHRSAAKLVQDLTPGEHYRRSSGSGSIQLTPAGTAYIHRPEFQLPIQQLTRTWNEYVEQALGAMLLSRDVHYIIDKDGAVQIVDNSTGRIFADRTWRAGLHQAVEAKEGLKITSEQHAMAQITRQRFSRLYERLAGMTGTATGCEREFRQVYRLQVWPIPLRTASRREIWPARFFANQQTKWSAIADSVAMLHQQQRPILVGTRSIADSERLAEMFRQLSLPFQLLNGKQDATEAAIISQAGQLKAITIATSLAGRGTDISLGPQVAQRGGLHVVVSECDDSTRIDRQLIGRCGRQGDPGSAQIFVSAEDSLLVNHGAWLAHSIVRYADSKGEVPLDLMPQVRRIQLAVERSAYGARAEMLRRDLARDSLYSRQKLAD